MKSKQLRINWISFKRIWSLGMQVVEVRRKVAWKMRFRTFGVSFKDLLTSMQWIRLSKSSLRQRI